MKWYGVEKGSGLMLIGEVSEVSVSAATWLFLAWEQVVIEDLVCIFKQLVKDLTQVRQSGQ